MLFKGESKPMLRVKRNTGKRKKSDCGPTEKKVGETKNLRRKNEEFNMV